MPRSLSRLPLVALATLLLAGCQLPTGGPRSQAAAETEARLFTVPVEGKKTSIGQLRYVTPARAVIGDAVVTRSGATHFQADFTAGPGVPLMRLQIAEEQVLADGLFAWGRWSGKARRAGRLSQWVALRDIFYSADTPANRQRRTISSPASAPLLWEATVERHKNGSINRLQIEFPTKKERFSFVFAP